ncbi:MAG: phenylalanine--tRNA ligase subunit beta, partial [Coriobacteriales bacterium]|nr:phenylalanine--tRNA ligase subunit beta [Coriobacteriales bacterium]
MLISHSWLKTLVDAPDDIKALCDRFDLTGTGVEGITTTGSQFDGIFVGQILTREPHPESDHLWVTTVDVGQGEPLQIVCGAQNFVAGDKVPVATVGTTMPDGETKIKKSKLRGVTSCGMNCSARELGLGDDHSGLMILPADAPVGMPIAQYLGISDTIIDVEITPNRPDCLSMYGMAREVGAMYDLDVTPERFELVEDSSRKAEDYVNVVIDDPVRCPRYTARIIENVKIGPSPDWLVKRLQAMGARPINNVVDATNYILFSLGQPLHAFDYDKLPKYEDGKACIVIRAAKPNEPFTTLDGVDRVLIPDMTVITDGEKPVCLAGVMGGLDSEVTADTTTVLLECATFSTAHTSRTSRNLTLSSESSMRYERGVDANGIPDRSAQAAALIALLSGGTVASGIVDVYPQPVEPKVLPLRTKRLQDFVGAPIPVDFMRRTLTRLGCKVEGDDELLQVTAPTFRPDLEREIDL